MARTLTGKPRAWIADRRLVAWLAVATTALVIALAAGITLATRSTPAAPHAVAPSAEDRNAPASLVQAAEAIGFRPTTEPGVGEIESKPAIAAPPAVNPNLLAVGTQAPGFQLRTPTGERVSLTQFRGKAVLLEFFATWCAHCNAEAPHLRALAASLPTTTYAFLAINADGETAPSVYAYHRYHGLQFSALLDPGFDLGSYHHPGAPGRVSNAYHVGSYPTFYVLDRQGRIVWRSDGEQPDALLRLELRNAATHG